jgi:hypothetical protein
MKKYFNPHSLRAIFLGILMVMSIVTSATVTFAQSTGPTPYCEEGVEGPCTLIPCQGTPESPCGFPELIKMIDGLIMFVLTYLVLPIAVIILIWGGFLYLTSGGNPAKRTKANKMFKKLFIGLFFCLAAWMIVEIILNTVGYDDETFSPVIRQ